MRAMTKKEMKSLQRKTQVEKYAGLLKSGRGFIEENYSGLLKSDKGIRLYDGEPKKLAQRIVEDRGALHHDIVSDARSYLREYCSVPYKELSTRNLEIHEVVEDAIHLYAMDVIGEKAVYPIPAVGVVENPYIYNVLDDDTDYSYLCGADIGDDDLTRADDDLDAPRM